MYQLNHTELATVKHYREAMTFIFTDVKIARETYCFTSTSIGRVVEVEFTIHDPLVKAHRVFRYDVTDYDSW